MSPIPPIRIGTRKSLLARTQSGHIQAAITAALGAPPEAADEVAPLVFITTTGDRIQDRRLTDIGGKALFTKEIEECLLDGRIDVAVHSMKDVPAEQPPGLCVAAIPVREDPRDAFVSGEWDSMAALPQGARLGTASLRRQAQALKARPDLVVETLRGNVDTRLARLAAGDFDAILLAAAGLNRLGLNAQARGFLDPWAAPPAPGQGALALQAREGSDWADWLNRLNHAPTEICVAAERGALTALEASCRTAMGAFARIVDDRVELAVEALAPDGAACWRREGSGAVDAAEARQLGLRLGAEIKAEAGDLLLE
ncbi:hydroxymethylbilane synthase [Brevundimonas sp.]|uniref:hydroxymethylbilane synthase n=1 Tax=Brevundimonas sp. TaxID=1871086 RepID=UPI0025D53589|nr:hydroxymethylbilane synthase [Brevundimonas sp.]